jgi:phage gp16-like protein
MTKAALKSPRLKLYGRIHILLAEAGIDDDRYRDILWVQFQVESKSKLTERQLLQLIQHIEELMGVKLQQKGRYPGRPRNMESGDRKALLKKIEALLAEAGRPWDYATGIARNMFKVDKVEWCQPEQLKRIVAALTYDAKRHGRRTK